MWLVLLSVLCVCKSVHIEAKALSSINPQALFLRPLPCYCLLRQGLSQFGAHKLSWAGQKAPGILLSLSPQHWDYRHTKPHLVFFCDFWHSNSGPLTKPSSHSLLDVKTKMRQEHTPIVRLLGRRRQEDPT